jgi:hypothetical protein
MTNKSQELSDYLTYAQMNLINDFRYNVFQLVMWSRSLINVIASDLKSIEVVTRKIHTMPGLFYNALKPYMGDQAAQEAQNYILQHILIFTRIIYGLKNGDRQAVDENIAAWYQAADAFSDFMARSNLYWNRDQWRMLLYNYMELTIRETVALLSQDYETGISTYDRLQDLSLIIADYISRGLIQNLKKINRY